MLRPIATLLASACVLAACGSTTDAGRFCAGVVLPAVTASVPGTTAGFNPATAWFVVKDGPYADSSRFAPIPGGHRAGAAIERDGTYNVTVRAPGFLDWTQAGVVVTRGDCNVNTVNLQAALQPAPS